MTNKQINDQMIKAVLCAIDRLPQDKSAMSAHYYAEVIIPMVRDIVIQYTHYLSAPSSLSRNATHACDVASGLMDALWFACYAREIMSREEFNDKVGGMFYELCYPISRMVRDSEEDIFWILDLEKKEGLC